MKRKIVSIFVFLTLLMTAFAIVPTNVNAQDGDFDISVYPSSQTVNPGGSVTFLVTVTSIDGFDSPVDLSTGGLPDGTSASFNPNPVTPTGNSILTISTSEDTPTGSYTLTIIGTSGVLTHSTSTTIEIDFGLVPKQFGTFTGRVTGCDNPEDGIEGVTVRACDYYNNYGYRYRRYANGIEYFTCVYSGLSTTTDENGYYTITDVPLGYDNAPRDWVVAFHIAGYSATHHIATASAGTITTVDMELCHAGFTGTVVDDETGDPIPGASIYTYSNIQGSYVEEVWATTNEDGEYTLYNMPLDADNGDRSYSYVKASADGYCDQIKPIDITVGVDSTLDFSLIPKKYGTFTGRVTSCDNPEEGLEGVTVLACETSYRYYYYRYANGQESFSGGLLSTTTNEDGYYTFDNVPLGDYPNCNNPKSYFIAFYIEGYSATHHIATAEADITTTVNMQLCHAGITGTVVVDDETGDPIEGAEIYAYSYIYGSYVKLWTTTNDEGVYTLPNIPLALDNGNRYYSQVTASAAGYCDQTKTIEITSGSTSTLNFSLIPIKYGTFTGQVTDLDTEESIPGVNVYAVEYAYQYYGYLHIRSWDGSEQWRNQRYRMMLPSVTTDSDGYYTIENVPLNDNNEPKDWVVVFHIEGYSATHHIATAEADITTIVDMELCHAGIKGKVVDADSGDPIEGAFLSAYSRISGSEVYAYAKTDEEGIYNLLNLPLSADHEPRYYTVTASASGYYDQTKYGTIFCGGVITLDFAGPEEYFGIITGTVTDCISGAPIAGAFVGGEFGGSTYTDDLGQYTLTDVPVEPDGSPKIWEVTVSADGYDTQTKEVEVFADEESILDFCLFPPIQLYYLTVNTDPADLTTFTEEGWYEQGTDVELTAPSIEGYTFLYWDIDETNEDYGENPITVTMDSDHTATAHYFEWVTVSGHKYEDTDGTQPTTTPLEDWTVNLYSFCDDFEDEDDDGWEKMSGTWSVIDDGGDWVYSGTATGNEQITYALSAGTYSDFTIEAELKAANSVGHYGLVLREDGSGNHYGFYLNAYTPSQGLYWFGYWDGSYHPIIGWTDSGGAYTDANTWNKVKVIANGYDFKLYINDILVNTVTDTTEYAASGYAGLIIDHFSGQYQNTYFDDFCIYDSTVTDSDGYYEFTIKKPGTYELKEELQEGWTQTYSTDGYTITIDEEDAGTTIIDQDFWNFEWFNIYGHKYFDGNGDGTWNNDEPYLDGWTINLDYDDETDSVITGDDTWDTGYYEFTIKEPGTYMVSEDTPDIWTKTEPAGDYHQVIAQSGVDVELDFGNWFEGGFVTDSNLCYFDMDEADGQQFRVIFTPDINNDPNLYKVSATNPGQFYYHVFYSGEDITGGFEITLADNFETQGANPVHVYSSLNAGPLGCLIPGNDISDAFDIVINGNLITVSPNEEYDGFIYITVHCDYALKQTGSYELQYYDDDGVIRGHAIKTPDEDSIYDMTTYSFSVNGLNSFADEDTIQNRNEFKKFRGIVGFYTDSAGGAIPDADITISGPSIEGGSITLQTDEDGFYGHSFFHNGKPATYNVEFPGDVTIDIILKAGHFAEVSYQVT